MTGNAVVPFGKYRDKPVDVMMQDRSYCEWALGQAWVHEKYPKFVQVIIAGGVEPQDTPEHNAMQAQFLDPAWFAKLGAMVKDRVNVAGSIGTAVHERVIEAAADQSQFWGESASPQFEVDGWDVVCMFTYWGRATGKIGSQYDLGEPEKISEFEGNFESEHRVLIELKPMMSDDYPTVMRQIMSRPSKLDGHRFLVVRQVSFQHVTWEQVQAIFETASITALLESDIAP